MIKNIILNIVCSTDMDIGLNLTKMGYRPRNICTGYAGAVTRSCIMNCYVATPSIWGNSTEICVSGKVEV